MTIKAFAYIHLINLLLLGLAASWLHAEVDPIVVIVNKANAIEELGSRELSRIYKGAVEEWPNGQSIIAINRPFGSDIRVHFYHIALKAPPTKKFFRPGSPVPFKTRRVKSGHATRKFVSRLPNAIGYLYLSEVDDTVKILKIDGLLPTEAAYPLK